MSNLLFCSCCASCAFFAFFVYSAISISPDFLKFYSTLANAHKKASPMLRKGSGTDDMDMHHSDRSRHAEKENTESQQPNQSYQQQPNQHYQQQHAFQKNAEQDQQQFSHQRQQSSGPSGLQHGEGGRFPNSQSHGNGGEFPQFESSSSNWNQRDGTSSPFLIHHDPPPPPLPSLLKL
jgi:hypothetical protein